MYAKNHFLWIKLEIKKVDGDGVVFRCHQLLAGCFPQITCRQHQDIYNSLLIFSVSGSHDYWLTPTIIYSRIVLSARQKLAARYLQTPSSMNMHRYIFRDNDRTTIPPFTGGPFLGVRSCNTWR